MFDKDFFKIIDTERKAYWLGFIYADGCVSSDLKSLIIELSTLDLEHLKILKNDMNALQPIVDKTTCQRYVVCNKELVRNLIALGCVPKKTFVLTFPTFTQVPFHLTSHFIRGYFDGDGCISIKENRKSKGCMCYDFQILGTYNFLNGIQKIFYDLGIDVKIYTRGKIFLLRTHVKTKILSIFDYMYHDSNVYLDRKYEKFTIIK